MLIFQVTGLASCIDPPVVGAVQATGVCWACMTHLVHAVGIDELIKNGEQPVEELRIDSRGDQWGAQVSSSCKVALLDASYEAPLLIDVPRLPLNADGRGYNPFCNPSFHGSPTTQQPAAPTRTCLLSSHHPFTPHTLNSLPHFPIPHTKLYTHRHD